MACPLCSKPTVQAYRPFCSRRCSDLDLAKWLGGGYSLPGQEPALFDDDPDGPDSRNPDQSAPPKKM